MEIPWSRPATQSPGQELVPQFSRMANQEPLRDKLTIAQEKDVMGVTEQRDFPTPWSGSGIE
jgi:hypothetical protein